MGVELTVKVKTQSKYCTFLMILAKLMTTMLVFQMQLLSESITYQKGCLCRTTMITVRLSI